MIIRLAVLIAVAAGVVLATIYNRVFGFSVVSALATLFLYLPLEVRRYRVERPFFAGRSGLNATAMFIAGVASINAFARAAIVGAAALFTFPSPDMFAVFDESYAAQLAVDARWTFYLFGGAVLVAVVISLVLDVLTNGRGHRWSLFRLAAIYGVIFSVGAFAVQQSTQNRESPVFAAPRGEVVLKAFREAAQIGVVSCDSFAVAAPDAPDGVTRPLGRTKVVQRSIWRANGCGAKLTPQFCDSLKQPNGGFAPFSLNRSIWKDHGCDGRRERISFAQLMSVITVLDDFVDHNVVGAASAVIGDRGPLSKLVTALLAIFVSSNVIQGVVISTYATLILSLTRNRPIDDMVPASAEQPLKRSDTV